MSLQLGFLIKLSSLSNLSTFGFLTKSLEEKIDLVASFDFSQNLELY